MAAPSAAPGSGEPRPHPCALGLARAISVAGHPLVLAGALVALAGGARHGIATAALTALGFALAVALPIVLFSLLQVRSGRWGNFDASDRRERPALFTIASGLLALLLPIALLVPEARFLLRGLLGVLALFAVAALANRWQKISLHLAFAALLATAAVQVDIRAGLAAALLVPLLAWSRLTLGRHTVAEVAIGTLVGIAVGLAIGA